MKRFCSVGIRIGLCLFIFIIYLYGWRPVRKEITQHIVYPQLAATAAASPGYAIKRAGVALRITFPWRNHHKTTQYRPQAGFFFLISIMTMVFAVGAGEAKWYLLLGGLHILSTFVTAALMIASKKGWYPGFILVDFIVTYLVPVLTLALAAAAVAEQQRMK